MGSRVARYGIARDLHLCLHSLCSLSKLLLPFLAVSVQAIDDGDYCIYHFGSSYSKLWKEVSRADLGYSGTRLHVQSVAPACICLVPHFTEWWLQRPSRLCQPTRKDDPLQLQRNCKQQVLELDCQAVLCTQVNRID